MQIDVSFLKMSLKLVVCWICLWITVTDVSAKYVLSNEKTTWDNAKKNVNFATPKIQVDSSSLTVDTRIMSDDLNENEGAWVGYYKKESAFAYIGCGLINNTKPTITLPEPRNSPGLCYSMCHKSYHHYIGLNKGKCFCLREKPSDNIYLAVCNISTSGRYIAGGGNIYMSIYKKMKTDFSVRNRKGEGKCLIFEYHTEGNHYEILWSICSPTYLALCIKDGLVYIPRYITQSYYEWQFYVQTCFENNCLPVTYYGNTSSLIVNATGQSWTNVIRSEVIYNYNEASNSAGNDNDETYGYVTKNGNTTVLTFTNKSNRKRFFLQTNIWTTSSDDMKTFPTFPAWNTASSSSPSSFTSSSKSGMRKSDSSDVSVAVSVSIVIVVILVAVVIIVILKRRGKIPNICVKIPVLDKSLKRTSDRFPAKSIEYVESQETDYAQIDEPKANNNVDASQDLELSNGHYAHTYFVLESGTRESNTDADISDSTNINTEINDDYNTLQETVNADTKDNDTYDTTEKAALKLKELQRAEDKEESPKMLNETEEDTYNRIDRSPLKKSKTDNIYGIPNSLENDYGDVGKTREKNLQDVDDTYNHVKLNQ